jgi:hypothetical protein
MIGEGPAARSVKLDLPPFTLVGATRARACSRIPLRDRFGIVARLEFYTPQELTLIVHRSAKLLGVPDRRERGARDRLAARAARRGSPTACCGACATSPSEVERRGDAAVADTALRMLEVDAIGLDLMDRKLLSAVIEKFGGGPVGVENLSAAIGEERDTIEDVLEPFLIQQATCNGRSADGSRRRSPTGISASCPRRRRATSLHEQDRHQADPSTRTLRLFVSSPGVLENTDAGGVCTTANTQVPRAGAHRMAAPPRVRPPGARAQPSGGLHRDVRWSPTSSSPRAWTTRSR